MSDAVDALLAGVVARVSEQVAHLKQELAAAFGEQTNDATASPRSHKTAHIDSCPLCKSRATTSESQGITGQDLARLIDHTLLKADATRDDIVRVCREAREWNFASVCVNSAHIPLAAECLKGSAVNPIAVVGFPLGAMSTSAKAFEARQAVADGAREIDMVISIGALKSHDFAAVADDIRAVVAASGTAPVKVILEMGALTEEEKMTAIVLAKASGAAFVKTSTGFGPGGATVDDIALMRRIVGDSMGVKASGGVRTAEDAARMVAAGACRIGASSSVAMMTGAAGRAGY